MSGVLIKIKSHYDRLPGAYRRLAAYVLKHPDEVPFLSVHKLAELAGVSVASATRFTHEIGYANFKEFKTQLGRDTLHPFEMISEAITPADGDDDIIDKAFSGNIRSLEGTLKILDRSNLKRAAEVIAKCQNLVFIGVGSSGYLARDAGLRFSQLGLPSKAHSDPYQVLNQSLQAGRQGVVFGISHSGRFAITVQAPQLAMQSGAMTVGTSNYPKSPLHRASRVVFLRVISGGARQSGSSFITRCPGWSARCLVPVGCPRAERVARQGGSLELPRGKAFPGARQMRINERGSTWVGF